MVGKIGGNNLETDMYIKTDLEGKIDNFKDFKSEALTPLFEAIVNSIQAIKERHSSDKGEITVQINSICHRLRSSIVSTHIVL